MSFTCYKTEKYFILSVANIFKRNTKCIVEKYYSYQWGCGLGIGEIMIGKDVGEQWSVGCGWGGELEYITRHLHKYNFYIL